MYNVELQITNIDESKYTKLIDFLEENQIIYNETEFEELDKEKTYEDYLMDQVDDNYEEEKMRLI